MQNSLAEDEALEELDQNKEMNSNSNISFELFEKNGKKCLSIADQGFSQIPGDIFDENQDLEFLYFDKNKLSQLDNVKLNEKFPKLQGLFLSHNILTRIFPTEHMPATLSLLDLSDNQIISVPWRSLLHNTNISSLDLSHNKIENLPDFTDASPADHVVPSGKFVTALKHLSLAHNQLSAVPEGFVNSLLLSAPLVSLDLRHNLIATLPNAFCLFERLESLQLCANPLSHLPGSFDQNLHSTLTTLTLSNCALSVSMPSQVFRMTSLNKLDLSNNCPPLTEPLSPEIGLLHNLTQLNLANNQIAVLPQELSQLVYLETLNLSGNPLAMTTASASHSSTASLPSAAKSALPDLLPCTRLTVFDLSRCGIAEFPDELCYLANLRVLLLAGNRLDTLPIDLKNLAVNLLVLDLSANRFTALPQCLGQLRNLLQLNLKANQLTTIPLQVFQLVRLRRLDLSENQLTRLPGKRSTIGWTGLKWLNLNGNLLTRLGLDPVDPDKKPDQSTEQLKNDEEEEEGEISALKSLVEFHVAHNRLTRIPSHISLALPHLSTLDVSHNRLNWISPGSSAGGLCQMDNLTSLNLSMNEFEEFPQIDVLPPNLTELLYRQREFPARQLTEELSRLSKLERLDVAGNDLRKVPAVLAALPRLRQLGLESNSLKTLPSDLLDCWTADDRMCKIERLQLGDNDLERLPALSWTKLGEHRVSFELDPCNRLISVPPKDVWMSGDIRVVTSFLLENRKREESVLDQMIEAICTGMVAKSETSKQSTGHLLRKLGVDAEVIKDIEETYRGKFNAKKRVEEGLKVWRGQQGDLAHPQELFRIVSLLGDLHGIAGQLRSIFLSCAVPQI